MTTAIRKPSCYLTAVERYRPPCDTSPTPELWWSPEDGEVPRTMVAVIYEERARQARIVCCTECPLHQQQVCAKEALDGKATTGVWAGVKLPGPQWRNIPLLAEARDELQLVADGAGAHELAANADLLEKIDIMHHCKRCDRDKRMYFDFYLDKKDRPLGACKQCRRESDQRHRHDEAQAS